MKFKKLMGLILSAVMLVPSTVFASSTYSLSQKRIFGKDRYETSALISKSQWQTSSNVLICSGENFPDALCAAPLARKYDAPILLTSKNGLSESTKEELLRLNSNNITIIGGTGVVPDTIVSQIRTILPQVKNISRLGGLTRYDTSKLIADKVGKNSSIVLVSGKIPADALSISSIAAYKNMPILLADEKDKLIEYSKDNNVDKAYIIGGETILPKDIEDIFSSTERIYGKDRYESNQKILDKFKGDMNFNSVYLTCAQYNGEDQFADALSISAPASRNCNPIVLVNSSIDDKTKAIIKSNVNKNSSIIAIGGTLLVSDRIVNSLVDLKSSDENHSSDGSGDSGNSSSKSQYTVYKELSFPGAFTYDFRVKSSDGTELKGYDLLYDGTVIASDQDEDGLVRPLSIFFGDDTDKSKFKIQKSGKSIEFTGLI